MKYITINNRQVEFTDEKNVLAVIRKAGIDMPTFCYKPELSTFGACRMCIVEDDRGRMFATCSETPKDGMVIFTHSPKVIHHRKMILELLLASHCRDCTTCPESGNCTLQRYAMEYGIDTVRFKNDKEALPIDTSSESIVHDPNKCILCGNCVRTCEELQGVGVLNFAFRGSEAQVMPAFNKLLSETNCVGCGQCRVACPTGALTIKEHINPVVAALADPTKRVVAQIAPAVRVAVGDAFGMPKGESSLGKLVGALHMMGFEGVYDTNLGADLTVMEESAELVERLTKGENLPLLTSCCPAWVKYCENRFPEYRKNISTCRSPQQMFGAVLKEDGRINGDNRELVVVSIMPCTAKKAEAKRAEHFTDGVQDVDYVLSTSEVIRLIKQSGINFAKVAEEEMDTPFGLSSGGGAIFGVTGGVTEAVLRKLVASHEEKVLEEISLTGIRGLEGIKEAKVTLGDREVKIAVVSGLKNVEELFNKMKAGEVSYDFIEVMACKNGCIAGGGQPVSCDYTAVKEARSEGLYHFDEKCDIRLSNENPIIKELYDGIIKGKEHKLLHNGH